MPDAPNLLAAIYVIGLATFAGSAYALLIQPGELLSFIPEKVAGAFGMFHNLKPFGWRKKVIKLFTCGKCIAGQVALWSFPFIVGLQDPGVVLLYLGTVCASIVLTSIILLYAGSNT